MVDSNSNSDAKPTDILSAIEKLYSLRFTLLLLTFVLAADVALLHYSSNGLISVRWEAVTSSLSIGAITMFLAGYALFMSITVAVFQWIAWIVVHMPVINNVIPNGASGNPAPGTYVSSTDLRDYALREKDSVAMKVYDDRLASRQAFADEAFVLSNLSAACVILMIIDTCLYGPGSAIRYLLSDGETFVGKLVLLPFVLIIGLWMYTYRQYVAYDREWFYIRHPHLAAQVSKNGKTRYSP